ERTAASDPRIYPESCRHAAPIRHRSGYWCRSKREARGQDGLPEVKTNVEPYRSLGLAAPHSTWSCARTVVLHVPVPPVLPALRTRGTGAGCHLGLRDRYERCELADELRAELEGRDLRSRDRLGAAHQQHDRRGVLRRHVGLPGGTQRLA